MNLFLEEAVPAGGGMGSMLIMLVVMFGLLYFIMIRPENKRKKEAEAMRRLAIRSPPSAASLALSAM